MFTERFFKNQFFRFNGALTGEALPEPASDEIFFETAFPAVLANSFSPNEWNALLVELSDAMRPHLEEARTFLPKGRGFFLFMLFFPASNLIKAHGRIHEAHRAARAVLQRHEAMFVSRNVNIRLAGFDREPQSSVYAQQGACANEVGESRARRLVIEVCSGAGYVGAPPVKYGPAQPISPPVPMYAAADEKK